MISMLRKASSLALGSLLAVGLTVAISPAGFADSTLAAAPSASQPAVPAALLAAAHQRPAADDAQAPGGNMRWILTSMLLRSRLMSRTMWLLGIRIPSHPLPSPPSGSRVSVTYWITRISLPRRRGCRWWSRPVLAVVVPATGIRRR